MIEIQGVTRKFRRNIAIDNVSLKVEKGELFGILGPDGSGKTTLLRMMAAIMNPTEGSIRVGEFDTSKDEEAVKLHQGYMPQQFGLYGDLSVEENLNFVAEVYNVENRDARKKELYEFAQLADYKDRDAQFLSGGMKKKLALACVLLHRPDVLLLDEPTTGVDPVARRGFWDLLSGLHAEGTTTIVSTPYMDEAERCNRVALLFEGKILACDSPANIKAMVPGKVLAVQDGDNLALKVALTGLDCILDMQTYGSQLNLIVSGDVDMAKVQISQRLSECSVSIERLDQVPMRMEEAFIYLVKQAGKGVAA